MTPSLQASPGGFRRYRLKLADSDETSGCAGHLPKEDGARLQQRLEKLEADVVIRS